MFNWCDENSKLHRMLTPLLLVLLLLLLLPPQWSSSSTSSSLLFAILLCYYCCCCCYFCRWFHYGWLAGWMVLAECMRESVLCMRILSVRVFEIVCMSVVSVEYAHTIWKRKRWPTLYIIMNYNERLLPSHIFGLIFRESLVTTEGCGY